MNARASVCSGPPHPWAGGPSFDVVVPCYNYGRFLEGAVRSVLDQPAAVRVLIIDDASSDETPAIGKRLMAEDPRVAFIRHPVNRGHIATYNEGIDWASGDFFALLSADDLLMPDALSRAATAFADHPELVMVYGRMLNFLDGLDPDAVRHRSASAHRSPHFLNDFLADGQTRGTPAREHDAPAPVEVINTPAFFRQHRDANRVPASGTFTRTPLQQRLGGYRPSLPHSGDYEMWLRFAAHGPVGFLPRFQVAVRRHRANMSSGYDRIQDVLQRARALQELEASFGGSLPLWAMSDLRHHIAAEALRVTTVALERRSAAERDALVAAARALDPSITRSPIWAIYLLKRTIGPNAWSALRRCAPRRASAP